MQVLQPHCARTMVWAPLRSLAATGRISFDLYSGRYLDVSVPYVGLFSNYFTHYWIIIALAKWGCPIQKSPDQSLIVSSPKLIAD